MMTLCQRCGYKLHHRTKKPPSSGLAASLQTTLQIGMIETDFPEVRVVHERSLPCVSFSSLNTKTSRAEHEKSRSACGGGCGL